MSKNGIHAIKRIEFTIKLLLSETEMPDRRPNQRPQHASSETDMSERRPISDMPYRRPIGDRDAWVVQLDFKNIYLNFKYTYFYILFAYLYWNTVSTLIRHSPMGLRWSMSRFPIRYVSLQWVYDQTYGSTIRHVGLQWVSDNYHIFVNSRITNLNFLFCPNLYNPFIQCDVKNEDSMFSLTFSSLM